MLHTQPSISIVCFNHHNSVMQLHRYGSSPDHQVSNSARNVSGTSGKPAKTHPLVRYFLELLWTNTNVFCLAQRKWAQSESHNGALDHLNIKTTSFAVYWRADGLLHCHLDMAARFTDNSPLPHFWLTLRTSTIITNAVDVAYFGSILPDLPIFVEGLFSHVLCQLWWLLVSHWWLLWVS